MTRHIADKPRDRAEGARLAPYLAAARRDADGLHPATRALHRRPAGRDPANARAAAFLRIGRRREV